MKKIAYLTGSRAEFGLMKGVLQKIAAEKNFELLLLTTGMHLLPEFGETINDVKKEFPQVKVINATHQEDNRLSQVRFLAKCTEELVEVLKQERPGVILVLGDRAEQLAMAQTAAYLNIPIVHLHGGETTTTIDNKARNAISMLADWHLTASKGARKKLLKMGVSKKNIQVVGAPGLDEITELPPAIKKDLIVILQHPDANSQDAAKQIKATLEAATSFKLPIKIIYPNSDPGGREMIQIIENYAKKYPHLIKTFPNIARQKYLSLLNQARVLLGNSSGGLIEAPSLKLPAVNIGPRQKGRERGNNVIDCDYNQKHITKAISKALGKRINKIKNPYGDGKTRHRVLKFLKKL